jgi:hypothetical protein
LNKLLEIHITYGWLGWFRLALYPVTTLFTTPFRLIQTLWNCRVLAKGKLNQYNRFTLVGAINSLFYWTLALNFSRLGRSERSPHLSLGDCSLTLLFQYNLISLNSYWKSSNLTVLTGMFGWWAFHLLWLNEIQSSWVALVMGLTLISTSFYSNTFSLQNYNALGWLFFPLALYGMLTEQWSLSLVGWLLVSFTSFTVCFIGGILSLALSISSMNLLPTIVFIPAGIKLLTHLYLSLKGNNLSKSIQTVLKSIGFIEGDAKYRNSLKASPRNTYYGFLYFQYCLVCFLLGDDTQLLWVGLGVFYLNAMHFRFADDQSLNMMMLGLACAILMLNLEWWILCSFWLLVSPAPLLAGFYCLKVLDIVPKLSPFPIQPFLNGMEEFLKPATKNEKIFMAFNHPKGEYLKIFDGYKFHIELPFYIANKRELLIVPNSLSVLEANYEGAPDFWGREVDEVLENVKKWDASYAIIYQEEDKHLDGKWTQAGFRPLTEFDWKNYSSYFDEYDVPKPKWWLLRPPDKNLPN